METVKHECHSGSLEVRRIHTTDWEPAELYGKYENKYQSNYILRHTIADNCQHLYRIVKFRKFLDRTVNTERYCDR